jgi:hypothetical protein
MHKRMLYYSSARLFLLRLEQACSYLAVHVWSRSVPPTYLQAGIATESKMGCGFVGSTVGTHWNVLSR